MDIYIYVNYAAKALSNTILKHIDNQSSIVVVDTFQTFGWFNKSSSSYLQLSALSQNNFQLRMQVLSVSEI